MIKQYKIARRLQARVFPKTENPKLVLTPRLRRTGFRRRRTLSEYAEQLLEKQKVRYSYGLRERQFSRYVHDAAASKGVRPAAALFEKLESRLDNAVFRLGFADTRRQARQLVSHGHIAVNNKKVTIPSFSVQKGDVVSIQKTKKNKKAFEGLNEKLKEHTLPAWLSLDRKKQEGKILSVPVIDDASELLFDLTAVIGFYTR